jgi:hypothetical protein
MFVNLNMEKFILLLVFTFIGCSSKMTSNVESPEMVKSTDRVIDNTISIHQVVEAVCGQCQFGITEKLGCDLAVRIEGNTYFVDGTNIHEHGDAHAEDGFCEAIRRANVKGKVVDGRFKSESFDLIK